MDVALFVAFLSLFAAAAAPPPSSYAALKEQAEGLIAEKSFSRAHALYAQASALTLPAADRRWVDYRLADIGWRGEVISNDDARKALNGLIASEDHDRIWAETNESLGDLELTRNHNFSAALPAYSAALDWWAGSDDLAPARRRYLAMVLRIAAGAEPPYPYGYYAPLIPREMLVNAVAIAVAPEDRAHARYLLAQRLITERQAEPTERALELYDEVIAMGNTTPWYDDALYAAARILAERGMDNKKALVLYRRLLDEHTPYADQARLAITNIESPSMGVMVSGPFLPKSEQEIVVTWRNVKEVELSISAVDLITDVKVDSGGDSMWQHSLPTGRGVRRWIFKTNDRGDHAPGTEKVRLTPKLEPGAYTISAAAAGAAPARQLLLVTDANVIVHHAAGRADIFVCHALTGEPMPNARLRVWRQVNNNEFAASSALTDANGLASVRLARGAGTVIVLANANGRQAWASVWDYSTAGSDGDDWKIYAFTDRPAYRPGETAHWKVIARVRHDNRWVTPAKQSLKYEIFGPRSESVAEGTAKLNEFGSFWSDLPVTASMALGNYTIHFGDEDNDNGVAVLFRLEEYKLPEFRVDVKMPEEKGKKKQFRLGETVEATIEATYYFGGPVANATVEAIVAQAPLTRTWAPWREYDWYFAPPFSSGTTEIKRETLKTDANGRATLRFETSADDEDTAYFISANVTDASRREVSGEGTVNVTKQRYSVLAEPEHYLLRAGDNVTVRFKAVDANDEPVQTAGTVKVVRSRWQEPRYREEEVLSTTVSTDAKGEAAMSFRAPRNGYYVVRWTSEEGRRARDVVRSETAVWVTDRAVIDLGYHTGELEIIVDQESFRAGQTAPVMIVTPASGRTVLLTTAGDSILDTQVLRLDGTVKLVQLKLDERYVPSFGITASSVFDRVLSSVAQAIAVPPVEHFINVDVKPDRAEYEPRQDGTVVVTARDVDGRPVRAEVALAVADESVMAIQDDLAGDPRKTFYDFRDGGAVNVSASVQMQRYLSMVEDEKGDLIDESQLKERDAEANEAFGSGAPPPVPAVPPLAGGVAGGMVGDQAVSEMITIEPLAKPVTMTAANFEVHVRSDFRSTAFWQPDVVTGADGTARVTLKFPEALTTWRATARAVSGGTDVGMASATATTRMPLLVRLEAPRFFVAGDHVTVSAVINNNTGAAMKVAPSIEVEGLTLETASTLAPLDVPPHGEARADWKVAAERAGEAKLRVTGRGADRGDAMEKSFTVFEHGVDKLLARAGKVRGGEATITLDLPHDRRATALTVRVQPSLAAALFDALPYLLDYPYGCTEQTMSRFLPAAVVAKAHPKDAKDLRRLADVTKASMARLYDFQHDDGGWGWWKEGESDDFMTAYVVWGFAVAREGGLTVDDEPIGHAVQYLDHKLQANETDWQEQAWMLHALGAWRTATHDRKVSAEERLAIDNVWRHRERLTVYTRALFTIAAHDFGEAEKTAVLVRNLEDGVKIDAGADPAAPETMATAHWGAEQFWWRWYEGPVESTAFALQALVRVDPKNKLIEPAMNWLVKNRRGARWNNTRDTAVAILALEDYLSATGELQADARYELSVNGELVSSSEVPPSIVRDANDIRIRRTAGKGPLYFAVEGRFVSLEEPVTPASNEIAVRRDYVRLAPTPTLLKGIAYDRIPLADGGAVGSGERVEVILTIETKNDYDYLLFEDLKPAGLEAVSLRSGELLYATSKDRTAWVYQELRDRKVALFIDHLPAGTWEIRYTLRAESPGTFHALPLLGQAMYVPEVHANGEEVRITVRE